MSRSRKLTLAQIAKAHDVILLSATDPWHYHVTNARAQRWGSQSPHRCAQACQVRSKTWRNAVAVNEAASVWLTEGLEATLHEIAHLVCGVADEPALEQEIAWLPRIVDHEACWIRDRLVSHLPIWGVWTSTLHGWYDANARRKLSTGPHFDSPNQKDTYAPRED